MLLKIYTITVFTAREVGILKFEGLTPKFPTLEGWIMPGDRYVFQSDSSAAVVVEILYLEIQAELRQFSRSQINIPAAFDITLSRLILLLICFLSFRVGGANPLNDREQVCSIGSK